MIEKKEPCNLCRKHGFIISVSFSTKDCDMSVFQHMRFSTRDCDCFLIQHDKQQINLMLSLHLSVRVAETKNGHLDIIGNIL